jgi:hypothetical protein
VVNTYEPDDCCAKALAKALETGQLDNVSEWTHAKCGMLWAAKMIETDGYYARHWTPRPIIEVWR